MTRPNTRLAYILLRLCIASVCILVPAVFCVAGGISQDKRLAPEIEFKAHSTELSQLLAGLSKQLGVNLSAEPVLATTPMSGRLSKRGASQALRSVADLLLAEWITDGDGYKLVRTKTCLDMESEIRRTRDWTIAERLEHIKAGLSTPAAEWKAAMKGKNSFSYFGKNEQIHGLSMPDDAFLAERLAYPYSRAVLSLLSTLPVSSWNEATHPAGVELPLAGLPKSQRDTLAGVLTSKVEPAMWETWPGAKARQRAAEALKTGRGKLFLQLQPDQLGRWASAHCSIRSSGGQIDCRLPFGRDFPEEHMIMNVMGPAKPGAEWRRSYQKTLPESDTDVEVGSDPWMLADSGVTAWPLGPAGRTAPTADEILDQLYDKAPVDYLSTRYFGPQNSSASQAPISRGQMIDCTAYTHGATWERARGVVLFREKYWPLKRELVIPPSFFSELAAKLSPEKMLSLDDLSQAAAKLSPKQKHWWRNNMETLPFRGYMSLLTGDHEHALDIWRAFTPDQQQRMKIADSPEPGYDPYAGGKGISINELSPRSREYLTKMLMLNPSCAEADFDDVRIGWMHYRVSDGHERDRLDYRLMKKGSMVYGSCFFEIFHPRPQDWN